jgi:hypothetical protein
VSTSDRFVSWVRGALPPSGALTVSASGKTVNVPVSRYGPGDAIGISPSLIRGRSPLPDSIGMPPNLFPYIEFTQPDIPWWLTPGDPDGAGQLAPWLMLIVVEAPSGSPLGHAANATLPVLSVKAADLPPSNELAQWAHVQIAAAGTQTEDVLRAGVARILSPRALQPTTRYCACLVPVFEAGRLAGLGQAPTDPMSATLAWTAATEGSIQLPVYDHWFFATAASGDFETLARKLRGRDISSGSRPLDVNVSAVSGDVDGQIAPFEGALRPVGSAAQWTGAAVTASSQQLSAWMKREAAAGPPVVGPPIYGSIQAGKTQVNPGWMSDLNLDPRRRAAAGLGVEIVRDHQDTLVDEAWRQVGDLQKARREHSGAQLADIATLRLHTRMIAPLAGAHALLTMAPAAARMRDAATTTIAARLSASTLQPAAVSAAFRRVATAKTPVAAKRAGQGVANTLPLLNARTITPGAPPPNPAKLVTNLQIAKAVLGPQVIIKRTGVITKAGGVVTTKTTRLGAGPIVNKLSLLDHLSPTQVAILTQEAPALDARQPQVVEVAAPKPFQWIAPAAPAVTASTRFNIRLDLGNVARIRANWSILATPRFQQALADWLDPAYLMAGVNIPPDTAGLLEVNSQFIESLLVGANHELSRELMWRGVPLDRAATLLTHFFGSTASAPPAECPPISIWKDPEALGSHVASGERAVFVLRSRLVGHLSEAVIYLAQAVPDGPFRKPGPTQLLPLFRGTAGVDTAYLGFNMPPEQLGGTGADLGWYLIIQEIEGAPRFGFDEGAPEALTTWNDVGWPLVGLTEPEGYVSIGTKKLAPAQPKNLVWGGGSAHMASISLQRPIRVSIHASLLLPPKAS